MSDPEPVFPMAMQDVQNSPASVDMAIDRVGVKDLRLPLTVRDRTEGVQHTVATVDMGVDLPGHFKGTHMSRFVESLEGWSEDLDYRSLKTLLMDVRTRLQARRAYVVFRFPYFIRKSAPATASRGRIVYDVELTGELSAESPEKPVFLLQVDVPVMTVCPCSLAISDQGAHSQRAMVRLQCRSAGFVWIEELIDIGENSASSPVYTLLKREDEKYVTEQAFAAPCFVEDVVRNAAQSLAGHAQIQWWRVSVESYESIHAHSAYAVISGSNTG